MSRENADDYQFVNTDIDVILNDLIRSYELITGRTVRPGSPERLFLSLMAGRELEQNVNINYAGNQNIPSRAEGENLDALGELFFDSGRPEASPATVMMRFHISEAQESAVVIPAGTRVAPSSGTPVFETIADASVNIGETTVDVRCQCQENGTIGNGFAAGQINTLIDVDNILYYDHCENTDDSGGGSDQADDDTYYELMVASEDAYSCAGAIGAYEYWAKTVSTDIADVVVNSPSMAQVNIYALMADGTKAGEEVKAQILEACSADSVRPLTDFVVVADPEEVSYDIKLTYYTSQDAQKSVSELEAAVNGAVQDYIAWQSERLGRDINPSKLIAMVMATGVKRVEVTSPVFTHLEDGRGVATNRSGLSYDDVKTPQLAKVGSTSVTNGGDEDE